MWRPGLFPTPSVVGSLNCSYGGVPALNFYIPRVLGFCPVYVHTGGGILEGGLGSGRMRCCGWPGGLSLVVLGGGRMGGSTAGTAPLLRGHPALKGISAPR